MHLEQWAKTCLTFQLHSTLRNTLHNITSTHRNSIKYITKKDWWNYIYPYYMWCTLILFYFTLMKMYNFGHNLLNWCHDTQVEWTKSEKHCETMPMNLDFKRSGKPLKDFRQKMPWRLDFGKNINTEEWTLVDG